MFFIFFLIFNSQNIDVSSKDIVFLNKGDNAPFQGYLFEKDFMKEFWIKVQTDAEVGKIELQKKYDMCLVKVDALKINVELQHKRIVGLNELITKKDEIIMQLSSGKPFVEVTPFYKKFWFGGVVGVVIGVSISVITFSLVGSGR